MKKFDTTSVAESLGARVLDFLNGASTAAAITTAARLRDDPDHGVGNYRIGKTVARRIIQRRNSLPGGRFTNLDQLDDIDGLGADKFHDLVYSFTLSAADEFVWRMYQYVIDDQWVLSHSSRSFSSRDEFDRIVEDPKALRTYVEDWLADMDMDKSQADEPVLAGIQLSFPDDRKESGFEWTLWCYRMGADRDFAFEDARREVDRYLSGGETGLPVSWCVFRGYQHSELLPSVTPDLPVTLNATEQCISLWQMQYA